MGNCVSGSKDVKEDDPPIEKAEVNNVQSIPTIEINGPSNSPSKENGLANNHSATNHTPEKAQSEPDESPLKQQSTPKLPPKEEEKEPLFPHVSPFKPQFDYRKDVTLSSRASKLFDDNTLMQNGVAGDLSLDASNREHGDDLENTSAPISPLEESGKDIDGVTPLSPEEENDKEQEGEDDDDKDSFTREVTRAIEEGEGKVSAETAEEREEDKQTDNQSEPTTTDPEQVQVEVVKETSEAENKSEDDNSQAAPAEESSDVTPTVITTTTEKEEDSEEPDKTTTTTTTATNEEKDNSSSGNTAEDTPAEKPEDRSAILAHFLSHQSGPEVAGSDDDESAGFQFAVKPDQDEEFLANQVEDDAIDQSQKAPHPLVNDESSGGKGDSGGQEILSALQKCAVAGANGEEEVAVKFEESDRQKLNELLNEIEQIAEQQNLFEHAPTAKR
ncbi:uncharacterized protein LOC142341433 isoform X2 [Convolutriloba macropyga]|uniref:uncharacterized protein LOC142341433 isoform X2 n=1 Tax=Convolutriloba macropyga TaxID=536237 RepID=UPI003F526821